VKSLGREAIEKLKKENGKKSYREPEKYLKKDKLKKR